MNILGRPHGTPRRADQEAQRKKKGKDIAHSGPVRFLRATS